MVRINGVNRTLILFVRILSLVKDVKNLKIFLMSDWVILMGMTLGTGHGGSHPGGKGGVYPIYHRNITELLIIGSSLIVGLGIAVKGGGN